MRGDVKDTSGLGEVSDCVGYRPVVFWWKIVLGTGVAASNELPRGRADLQHFLGLGGNFLRWFGGQKQYVHIATESDLIPEFGD